MVNALTRRVTIQPGGRIEITSPELPAGSEAEVIVLLLKGAQGGPALPSGPQPAEQRREGRGSLRKYFGSVSSGNPDSADNDQIDADLAREYGRGLDEAQ